MKTKMKRIEITALNVSLHSYFYKLYKLFNYIKKNIHEVYKTAMHNQNDVPVFESLGFVLIL